MFNLIKYLLVFIMIFIVLKKKKKEKFTISSCIGQSDCITGSECTLILSRHPLYEKDSSIDKACLKKINKFCNDHVECDQVCVLKINVVMQVLLQEII